MIFVAVIVSYFTKVESCYNKHNYRKLIPHIAYDVNLLINNNV